MENKFAIPVIAATLVFVIFMVFIAFKDDDRAPNSNILIDSTGRIELSQPAIDREISKETFLNRLGTMMLTQLLEGKEAREQISKLHGKSITMKKGYIAKYQGDNGEKMTIWVSVHKDRSEAESQIAVMHEKIDKSPVFKGHQDINISGIDYHFVKGMGQSHYFYYRGKNAIWIGINSSEEMKVLKKTVEML